jgi:predicted nicotinamide N-methyase
MASLRFRYQTHEFDGHDIHLRTLRDNQQFLDNNQVAEKLNINSACWPIFGTLWASGEVLAHLLEDFDISGKRILEIGCGIGLPSMVLNHRHADITATDYHPEAEAFLNYNTALNDEQDIPFFLCDWHNEESPMGLFDLLIGSDVLYEQDHIELLSGFIDRHTNANCEVIVVDPGRRQYARFSKKMESLGFSLCQSKPLATHYLDDPFKGRILHFSRNNP